MIDAALLRKCFPANPLVEELGPDDIMRLGLPDTYWCQLARPFDFWSPLTEQCRIPIGFNTDGASIPEIVQPLVMNGLDPRILFAGYAHDYIFSLQGVLPNGITLTREQCNHDQCHLQRNER